MYRYKDLRLRKFEYSDIPNKIEWINNSNNNKYLHYDLPLEYEKTCTWFENNRNNENRFDAIIEYNGSAVGITGLLNIDYKNKKAEDYIVLGEESIRGKGIATYAGILNALYSFNSLNLNKLYSFIEVGNNDSMKLYRRRGFHVEGYLKDDLLMKGRFIDRYCLGLYKDNLIIPSDVYWEEA